MLPFRNPKLSKNPSLFYATQVKLLPCICVCLLSLFTFIVWHVNYFSILFFLVFIIGLRNTLLSPLGHMFSSVQFSRSVVSDSSWPHELQHARPPCPSPTPGVHWNSSPSSQWCHPAISSSVVPFSSCPQSLPASESFRMSQLFTWGGQSTGVSASASFLT